MKVDSRFYILRDHLWRGGKFGYYWLSDDGEGNKLTRWVALPTSDKVPTPLTKLDCYYSVYPSKIRRSEYERARVKDGDIAALNCLYFEVDCKTDAQRKKALAKIHKLPIAPSVIVNSGGGYHVYLLLKIPFLLDDDATLERAIELQAAMVDFASGDSGVKDLSRVLRVPGTTNWKAEYAPNFPTVTIEEWNFDIQYELDDLTPHLQPLIDARNAKAHSQTQQAGGECEP